MGSRAILYCVVTEEEEDEEQQEQQEEKNNNNNNKEHGNHYPNEFLRVPSPLADYR